MAGVTWRQLTLRGFGCFYGEAAIELGDGINVLVADNEQGKSTLVRGLAAVLFGLPSSSDAAEFGTARFLNWDRPARCEGRLEFERDGETFCVWRNFANHRVSLGRLGRGGWVEEVGGEHNPRARRPNQAYERRLVELVGVSSHDLFEATFCVVQPLPAAAGLAAGVEGLLSGAGAGYREALDRLTKALKALTRRSGELGVTPLDGRVDQGLERLDARAAELKGAIALAREAGGSHEDMGRRLAGLEAELKAATEGQRAMAGVLEAWAEWRALRDAYDRALTAQVETARAARAAEDCERRLAAARAELGRDFPDLHGEAPPAGAAAAEPAGGAAEGGWDRLGSDPAHALQLIEDHAQGALRRWRRFREAAAALACCQEELSSRFSTFEGAGAEAVEALRNYQGRRATLEAALDLAQKAHAAAAARSELSSARARRRRLALAAGVGAAAGFLAWALWRGGGGGAGAARLALAVLAWLAAGGLAWVVSRRRTLRSAAVAGLDEATRRARRELDDFRQLTAPAQAAFGDRLADAVREWDDLRRRAAALAGEAADYAADELGATLETVDAAPVPPGPAWAGLRELAAACGREPAGAVELLRWLEGLGPDSWQEAHQGAARWAAADRRREQYRERRRAADAVTAELSGVLSGQGTSSLDELGAKHLDASNQAQAAQAAWQAHVRAHPGLPPAGGEQAAAEVERQYQELKAAGDARAAAIEGLRDAIRAVEREQARLEGAAPLNVAAAEVELGEALAERERVAGEVAALALAFGELAAAAEGYQAEHREELAARASARFGELCGDRSRRVALDAGFGVSLVEAAGRPVAVCQLSQGAQDQLFIALRLAVADLIAAGTSLPFIFDDPFLTCDARRLERIRGVLEEVASARQVLLFSHRPELLAWGRPVTLRVAD